MRLLIDECVPERFQATTARLARFANLAGLRNGDLLDAAEAAGFDALITVDQSIPDQQNLAGRHVALVILCGTTNRLRDLQPLAQATPSALDSVWPRQRGENQVRAIVGPP